MECIKEVLSTLDWDNNEVIHMDKVMMEYYLYRFKQWLGSVSRELQNRQLKDIPYDGDNGSYCIKSEE